MILIVGTSQIMTLKMTKVTLDFLQEGAYAPKTERKYSAANPTVDDYISSLEPSFLK